MLAEAAAAEAHSRQQAAAAEAHSRSQANYKAALDQELKASASPLLAIALAPHAPLICRLLCRRPHRRHCHHRHRYHRRWRRMHFDGRVPYRPRPAIVQTSRARWTYYTTLPDDF